MKKWNFAFLAAGFATFFFAGCTGENELLKQRTDLAVRHYEKSLYRKAPERTLTLADCIQLALQNTLDRKVGEFQYEISGEKEKERINMVLTNLPGLQYRYDGKGEEAVFSRDGEKISSLDLSLGIMDLALAYFNYRQDKNGEWSRKQAALRMAQNIALDVTCAYMDYLAAERGVQMIEAFLNKKNQTKTTVWERARKSSGAGTYAAFRLLNDYNALERQKQDFIGKQNAARSRLNVLMGYNPSGELKLVSPVLENVPELGNTASGKEITGGEKLILPELQVLEKIALLNRPELAGKDGQQGVNSIECAKVILELFPRLRLFLHYSGHEEDLLYNRSWWNLGIAASLNLLNLPSKAVELYARSKAWQAEKVASYGKSIAVIAQVRLAHSELERCAAALRQSDWENRVLVENARRGKSSGKADGIAETRIQIRDLMTRLKRLENVKNFYYAAGRLINTLGLNNFDASNINACQKLLADAEDAAKVK